MRKVGRKKTKKHGINNSGHVNLPDELYFDI